MNHPTFIRYFLIASFLSFHVSFATAATTLLPGYLTCEYIDNPLGIDIEKPRLSWQLTSSERNQTQTAYEILVSDNLKDIKNFKGNAWQTGKILSSQSIHIEYTGTPLKSFTRYYWMVRCYDKNDEVSKWSTPAYFETAMLKAADWTGKWIGNGSKQFEKDEDFYRDDPMPLFRKEIKTGSKILSANLYISGLGYYEAYLNGGKIGDHLLDPGFTTYARQVPYVTYDVTSQLKPGKNVIGIMLGNGWYNPLPLKLFSRFNLRTVQQTGRPCVKAQLRIRYADGTTDVIATNETWQTSDGPVIRNNVYLGEQYDARMEKENWTSKNYIDKEWKNAVNVSGPSGVLTAQLQPAIKITKVLRPIDIAEVGRDTFIVDMGQNFAGVAKIKVKGPAGTRVALRYGEDILANGSLNFFTTTAGHIKEIWNLKGGPGAPKTAWQEDVYTLKGIGTETWSPRFTFHGFRYVEITGWPGRPTIDDIEGLRLNTDLAANGSFACSNDMFNRLNEAIRWTFLSNVFSVQSDCPGREKMGYGADIVVTTEAFIYNFNMANFYRKTVQDFANEQRPEGGITEIAPYTGIADRGYGDESGPLGWQLAFPFVQKQLYDFYGDKRVIAEHYDAFKKQMDFLQSRAINELFHWDISDHEALDPKPEAFTASAFYYHHALLASEFAGILEKKDDSAKYAMLAQRIKEAIVAKYLVPATGRFDNSTQAAQLFALWYKLPKDKDASFKILLDEFARHNWHISTGIFATKMMFDVLRESNRNDVAYKVASQKDFPGWGYMLSKGATTLWESWQKPDQNSQNHPMFGSISEWFYRSLLGINAAAPGFEKILIKPQPAGDLKWAKGSYQSIRGNITSDWKKGDNSFQLTVSIPANSTAEVWIPSKANGQIMESKNMVNSNSTVRLVRYEAGYAVIACGSGEYQFTTEL